MKLDALSLAEGEERRVPPGDHLAAADDRRERMPPRARRVERRARRRDAARVVHEDLVANLREGGAVAGRELFEHRGH